MNIGASSAVKIVKSGNFIVDYVLLENSKEHLVIEVITNLNLKPFENSGSIKTSLYKENGDILQEVTQTAPNITITQRNKIIDNKYAIKNIYTENIGSLNDYDYDITGATMIDNNFDTKFNIKYMTGNAYTVVFTNLQLNGGDKIYISAELSSYLGESNYVIDVFGDNDKIIKYRYIQIGNSVDRTDGYENIIKSKKFDYGPTGTSLSFFTGISYFDYTYSYSSSNTNITTAITPSTSNKIKTYNWGMHSDGDVVRLFLTNTTGFKSEVCNLSLLSSSYEDTEYIPNIESPKNAFRIKRNCDYNGVNYYNNIQPSDPLLVDYYYPSSREKSRWSTDFTRKRKYEYSYEYIIQNLNDDPFNETYFTIFKAKQDSTNNLIISNTVITPVELIKNTSDLWIGSPLLNKSIDVNVGGTIDGFSDISYKNYLKLTSNISGNIITTDLKIKDVSNVIQKDNNTMYIFNSSVINSDKVLNEEYIPLSQRRASYDADATNTALYNKTTDYNRIYPIDVKGVTMNDTFTVSLLPGNTVYASNGTLNNGYIGTLTAPSEGVLPTNSIYMQDISNLNVGDKILVYQPGYERRNGVYVITDLGSSTTKWVLTRWKYMCRDYDYSDRIVRSTGKNSLGSCVMQFMRGIFNRDADKPFYKRLSNPNQVNTSIPLIILNNFIEDYYSNGHGSEAYLRDCLYNTIYDYPVLTTTGSPTPEYLISGSEPNCEIFADTPSVVKYLLEFDDDTDFIVLNSDDISVGKTNIKTTVAYSNFYVKRSKYKAYYNNLSIYNGNSNAAVFVENGKFNYHKLYGAYRMTSGVESLGFTQVDGDTFYNVGGKTFVMIPSLKTLNVQQNGVNRQDNVLKINSIWYYEQVYKNIIQIPCFGIDSDVYLKNIEITSNNADYKITVPKFVSSTIDNSNNIFMYEYILNVEILNRSRVLYGSNGFPTLGISDLVYDSSVMNTPSQSDLFISADFVLVFADSTGKEIRMKAKDINI